MKNIRSNVVGRVAGDKFRVVASLLTLLAASVGISAQEQPSASTRLITHPEPVKVLPGANKRWALVIGVDKYEDSNISPLRGSANDANSLKDALVKHAGFPEDQVIVLSSNEPSERQPTRKNILKRLSNLSGVVPKDGLLLLSFAGHGIDRSGRGFLIPSDATLTEDLGLLEETAISVNRVKQRIKDTGVQQVIILLDACRAYPTGRSDSSNPLTPAFTNGLNFDVRNREVNAFAILYATAVGSRAYEYGEKQRGYFSWAITQALSGAAANERGEITLRGLVKYLEDTVPKLVALDYGAKLSQRPFADIEGYRADELVLAVATANSNSVEISSVPSDERQSSSQPNTDPVQATLPSATRRRGKKSGNVVITFALSQATVRDARNSGILMALASEFTDPFSAALSKEGLSVDVSGLQIKKLDVSRFAMVIVTSLVISDLSPYNGLNIAEINGTLQAIDTDTSRSVRHNISRVRGFGNSQDQARRNALKNAAEGVPELFIKQLAANAR